MICLRSKIVALDWRWSSLQRRLHARRAVLQEWER